MSRDTEDADGRAADAAEFLRPLQVRTRTEGVIRELSGVARLPRGAALMRATGNGLAWETLVAMARAYQRAGDTDAARRVMDALVRRVSPSVAKRIAAWSGLTPEERNDAKQETFIAIVRGAMDLGTGKELWECNFTGCFNWCLINAWRAARRRREDAVSLTHEGGDGEEYDGLERIADPTDAFALVEDPAFFRRLAYRYPRIAEMVHLRLHGFSDREISARLGVTDRTLRNWAKTAQALWNEDTP